VIFLSYSWEYRTAAHSLDAVLRHHGHDVWIDFRQLNLRADISKQLELAIRDCELFLAFQPAKWTNSRWMTLELLIAIAYARPILQIRPDLTQTAASETPDDWLSTLRLTS
jgi:hypothetical protein